MTELGDIFVELGVSQYLDAFVEHGFDTWETILDITESDFNALGVKLGHRRKIQRRIANSRGLSSDQALVSPTRSTSVDDRQLGESRPLVSNTENKDGGNGNSGKRKYRRHPKPDENAPERPPSAYVIFSNKMRMDLKGRNLSFTEIAKLVGENWQALPPSEKEPYEAQAFSAKEKYNAELAEYKKTDNYKKYSEYLIEFKEKQAGLQHVVTDASKRPKLEHKVSTGSSGATSSAESQQGADRLPGLVRGASTGSTTNSRFSGGRLSPPDRLASVPSMNASHEGRAGKGEGSPTGLQSGLLPGYRDYMFSGGQQQTLAWRDSSRRSSDVSSSQYPSITNMSDRRSGQHPTMDVASQFGIPSQNDHRSAPSFSPPPLLTSESTTGTTGSNSSSIHHMPRTPLEPSLERPLPGLHSSKPYDNQLPPLRSISLSPQSSIDVSYNSPSGIYVMDYPPAHSRRTFPQPYHLHANSSAAVDRAAPAISANTSEEEVLDPVSALLKADEIVSRTSRNPPL